MTSVCNKSVQLSLDGKMYIPGYTVSELVLSSARARMYSIPPLSWSVSITVPCAIHEDVSAPGRVYLNIFAVWLTTRFVIAPIFACADPGVLGSGEKNGDGSFGTGNHLVLVNGTKQSRGRAIS